MKLVFVEKPICTNHTNTSTCKFDLYLEQLVYRICATNIKNWSFIHNESDCKLSIRWVVGFFIRCKFLIIFFSHFSSFNLFIYFYSVSISNQSPTDWHDLIVVGVVVVGASCHLSCTSPTEEHLQITEENLFLKHYCSVCTLSICQCCTLFKRPSVYVSSSWASLLLFLCIDDGRATVVGINLKFLEFLWLCCVKIDCYGNRRITITMNRAIIIYAKEANLWMTKSFFFIVQPKDMMCPGTQEIYILWGNKCYHF